MDTEKATFGAGCFWGVEETFRNLKGVLSTAVGYAGGAKENPTYEDVCTDKTGHAEVVEVEFDPSQINYEELLDVFWSNHNPTTLNKALTVVPKIAAGRINPTASRNRLIDFRNPQT